MKLHYEMSDGMSVTRTDAFSATLLSRAIVSQLKRHPLLGVGISDRQSYGGSSRADVRVRRDVTFGSDLDRADISRRIMPEYHCVFRANNL